MLLSTEEAAPKFGYPDMGSGYFAKMLAYKDWYTFNNVCRISQNSLEHMPTLMPLVLCSGLFYPRFTATMAAVILGGRMLYR